MTPGTIDSDLVTLATAAALARSASGFNSQAPRVARFGRLWGGAFARALKTGVIGVRLRILVGAMIDMPLCSDIMWGKTVFVLRICAVAFVGLVGLALALKAADLMEINPALETTAWIVGLAVIAVDNIGTLFTRNFHAQRQKRTQDIESALMSALIQLVKTKDIRFEELGASVYVPKLWRTYSQHKAKRHGFKRLKRFRPGGTPPQSGIEWHSGHGTVGDCWKQKKPIYWDGTAIGAKYGEAVLSDMTEESFQKISSKTRQGFTYEEFRRVTGKYSEIIASPIWDSRNGQKLIGVLTVDRALVSGNDEYSPQLNSSSTREIVEITCRTLGTQLRGKGDG